MGLKREELYRTMASTNKLVYISGYLILLAFLALNASVQEASAEKDATLTRLGQNVGTPTLKFLYW